MTCDFFDPTPEQTEPRSHAPLNRKVLGRPLRDRSLKIFSALLFNTMHFVAIRFTPSSHMGEKRPSKITALVPTENAQNLGYCPLSPYLNLSKRRLASSTASSVYRSFEAICVISRSSCFGFSRIANACVSVSALAIRRTSFPRR